MKHNEAVYQKQDQLPDALHHSPEYLSQQVRLLQAIRKAAVNYTLSSIRSDEALQGLLDSLDVYDEAFSEEG